MRLESMKGTASDSLLLAAVRMITMLAGIASTMILSHKLSLEAYGSYSQANVIVSVGVSFSILGLSDAVNYFYNGRTLQEREKYVNTVFLVQFVAGIAVAGGIWLFRKSLCAYFHNAQLMNLLIYIAFRPLLENLVNMLQVLQVSIGRAKVLAVRNLAFSLVKVILALVIAWVMNDIRILFVGFFLFDMCAVIFYLKSFSKAAFYIRPFRGDLKLVVCILKYSLPMAVYVLTKNLLKDMDKIVIGYLDGTEGVAIYTNCAYALPLDVIANAFLIVTVPVITRYVSQKDFDNARGIFSSYLRIGYLTTCTFAAGLSIVASETICVLFGQQYLVGQHIFVLYLIVDMIKFANLSLILSAKGWTKQLMVISIGSLIVNLMLNFLCYAFWGFVGPAVASVIVSLLSTIVLCAQSAKALETSFLNMIDIKEVMLLVAEMVCVAIPMMMFRNVLRSMGGSPVLIVMLVGGAYVSVVMLLNWKKLIQALRMISSYR